MCPGYPPDRIGGVENYVSLLTEGLRAEKNQVEVLTRFWKIPLDSEYIVQKKAARNQLLSSVSWAVYARFLSLHKMFDIVHCHGLEGYLLSALPLAPKPNVVHVHNTVIPDVGFYDQFEHRQGFYVLSESLRRAKRIIIPTFAAKRRLIADLRFLPSDKIRVIPNMVDPDFHNLERVPRKRYPPLSDDDFVVLYFGKIKQSKGIEDICKAVRLVGDSHIKLVVGGAPTATTRYLDLLRTSYPEVLFTGRVPDPRLWYAQADIFCVYTSGFSGGETFSIALAEAMSMGLPVVCSDNPIFREVTGGNGAYATSGNPRSLADAIRSAYENKKLSREKGIRNREIAIKRFSPRVVVPEVESLYNEMV